MKFFFLSCRFLYILFLLPLFFLYACSEEKQIDVDSEMAMLKIISDSISKDFKVIQRRTDYLAGYTEGLYKKGVPSKQETLSQSEFGSFYKAEDDGGSAIFLSNTVTYDDEVKHVISVTSNLDSLFKDITDSLGTLVMQVRYSERHSFMRLYPYADVQSQFAPDMDIKLYRFYTMADDQHNTGRANVILSDPYVDPAGKGWIISSLSPVYYNYTFQGVAELDITVDAIKAKYIKNNPTDIMLVDSCGICIAIDDKYTGVFNMPFRKAHKYVQSTDAEDYYNDDINLLKSKDKKIRTAFEELIRNGKKMCELELESERYRLFSYKIAELNWFIVKFEKIN